MVKKLDVESYTPREHALIFMTVALVPGLVALLANSGRGL
jgi:hypothetical protein